MSNKIYTDKELIEEYREHPEVLFRMWAESEEKRVEYQHENIRLKNEVKHWRYEAEKFERFWDEKKLEQRASKRLEE